MKMKTGVKLFPGSIVALLLGVFLASPLLYSNIVMAPDATSPELFGVDVVYAYIERRNTSIAADAYYLSPSTNPNDTLEVTSILHEIGLNITRYSEDVDICDAKMEVYLITVSSNEGFIGKLKKHQGIIHNRSTIDQNRLFTAIHEFFSKPISGGGGATTNWPVGESRMVFKSGGGTTFVPTFGEPETIFITVTRLGWVIMNGDSTECVVLAEPEVVSEVQLDKYGDGFLYNTVIPEDELSQIDPLQAHKKIFELMEN